MAGCSKDPSAAVAAAGKSGRHKTTSLEKPQQRDRLMTIIDEEDNETSMLEPRSSISNAETGKLIG